MERVRIGYFSNTHGIKGQLLLKLSCDLLTDNLHALFIEMNGGLAPYFVKNISESGRGLLIGLESVDTVEQARPLLNREVFADASAVVAPEEEDDLRGYSVRDKRLGELGTVTEVTFNGAQELMHIAGKNGEIVLPLVDDFIIEIDDEKRTVAYDAPEGLIEVYMNG